MNSDSNSRSKARLIVVSVFVIGFAAGALSLNLYQQLTSSENNKKTPQRGGTEYLIEKMNKEVGLAPDQQEQIKKILDETSDKYREIRKEIDPVLKPYEPRFNAVRQESRDRIRALLNPDQLPKYEEMVNKHDKMREQERERSKK
jgi:hypothetical protein